MGQLEAYPLWYCDTQGRVAGHVEYPALSAGHHPWKHVTADVERAAQTRFDVRPLVGRVDFPLRADGQRCARPRRAAQDGNRKPGGTEAYGDGAPESFAATRDKSHPPGSLACWFPMCHPLQEADSGVSSPDVQ